MCREHPSAKTCLIYFKTLKFDANGNFKYTKQENYLYGLSKFNYKYVNSLFLKDTTTYHDDNSPSPTEEEWW